MAQQLEPIKRKVALKIIKPGMDTREVIARFEAERQALAMMDHPNIAQVLDAGATESADRTSSWNWSEASRSPTTATRTICARRTAQSLHSRLPGRSARPPKRHHPSRHQALQRPGNARRYGPVVKVIDFGVAKAIGQELTEKTLFTRFEQMIGTPLYMSPEQTEMSGLRHRYP